MSISSTGHKFGLPKPDFQALPPKKTIWPLLVIIGIALLLVATRLGYHFYVKATKSATTSAETTHNRPITDQPTDNSTSSPAQVTPPTKVGASGDGTAQPSLGQIERFKPKTNNKIKKSISATQKQLLAKQNKPLVKPGTYQELKEPQGIYHLVVVSHLDKQSAMKVVQQLIKKNLGVCLILPRTHKGEKYYRVTIGHSKTHYEADGKLKQFKLIYNDITILKY